MDVAPSLHRRPLPTSCLAFSSEAGRQLFRESLESGHLEAFFPLIEQFHTQSDPAFCGLGSLVMVLNALGRPAEALPFCEKAVKLEPDYAEAHSNLAVVLNALEKHESAARHGERAVALKPAYAEAHNNLGMALRAQGRHEEGRSGHGDGLRD